METHPQYLHWLGGVYVHPDFREQGIGDLFSPETQSLPYPEVQKLVLKGYEKGEEPITCRPADLIEPGMEIQFAKRDAQTAREDLVQMIEALKQRLPGPPRGGLYFSCLGRGRNQFGEIRRLVFGRFGFGHRGCSSRCLGRCGHDRPARLATASAERPRAPRSRSQGRESPATASGRGRLDRPIAEHVAPGRPRETPGDLH